MSKNAAKKNKLVKKNSPVKLGIQVHVPVGKLVLLSLPLMLAIIWLIFVLVSNKTFTLAGGAQLAPVKDIAPLIIGLCVFIAGYILFLLMMFSEDIKEILTSHSKVKNK